MSHQAADEEDAELLALQRIDDTSVKLQQEGKYLEALECMERGLVLRQHFFGADSEEVWRACKTVGEMCNLLAMTYLQQEDFAMVLELLKKADILTERDPPGRAVTYNNLACYYRRQGKLHAALSYLQKSLKIEASLSRDEVENPADTHLNMCAVLSQLGRHQTALEHAQSALILLQEELFGGLQTGGTAPQKADRVAVLAIAYHNIGVEQEFLKKFQQSVSSYTKGVEVAKTHLGPNHGITITLKNSLIAARRAISIKKHGKAATMKAKKGKRGGGHRVGRSVDPSDANVEKWGNITGVYGDIPGVKAVERKGSPGRRTRTRGRKTRRAKSPGKSTASPVPAMQSPAPADDTATQQMLDLVTPRREEADGAGAGADDGADATGGAAAVEESKGGGGDFEFPSFPASCNSLLAKHLTRDVYEELVSRATPGGATLADVCRQGVANPSLPALPGHRAALGVTAPDADAYTVFERILAPVIEEHHAGANLAQPGHVSSEVALDASRVEVPASVAGNSALSAACVLVCRNVAGEPFASGQDGGARERVYNRVRDALASVGGTFIELAELDDAGDAGADAAAAFGRAGISLDAPSPYAVASGAGNGWPRYRCVFASDDGVYVGINVHEHVAVVAGQSDGDVLTALKRVSAIISAMSQTLTWEFNERLGTVTCDPTLLGAATIVSVSVDESAVAGDVDAAAVAAGFGLASTSTAGHLRLWTVSGMNVGAATCTQQLLLGAAALLGDGESPSAGAGGGKEPEPETEAVAEPEPEEAAEPAAPVEDAGAADGEGGEAAADNGGGASGPAEADDEAAESKVDPAPES